MARTSNTSITHRAIRRAAIAAACLLALVAGARVQSQQTSHPSQSTLAAQTSQGTPASQATRPTQNAQAPPMAQGPAIAVGVQAVTMLATVRDKKGALVSNLTKDDFALDQDGHPETITYFVRETDLPLTLGLLVDTSGSQRTVLADERDASHSFLDHVLREDKDKAFLIHFDSEVELLQDLTPSRQKLQTALDDLGAPEFSQTNGGGGGGQGGGGRGGGGRGGYGTHGAGTLLYDAIYLGAKEVMQKQQGRKAVILLTDGVDRGSRESLTEAIETAQRADTLIYSVYFVGQEPGYGGGGFGGPRVGMGGPMGGGGDMGGGHRGGGRPQESRTDGKKILQQLSAETGGRFFEVTKKLTVGQIYDAIDQELRNQYSLGYLPEKADASEGYHKIHLTTKQKDLEVQTRDGYYATTPPATVK